MKCVIPTYISSNYKSINQVSCIGDIEDWLTFGSTSDINDMPVTLIGINKNSDVGINKNRKIIDSPDQMHMAIGGVG